INHYKVSNNSRAWVGEGASLTSRAAASGDGEDSNWDTALAGDGRKAEWLDAVGVQALSDSQSMHAAGELKIGSVQAGQDGAAIGGSFNNVVYDTTTIAGIAADAVVVADDGVAVDATTRDNVVSLALMSGKGSSIGVDGTMALLDVSSTTRASVSRDADVTAGSLEIGALQDLFVWSVSGALAMANSVSVGLGVGIHNLATDTRAYIGDNTVDAAGAGDDAQAAEGVRGDGRIRVDGLRVDAQSKGLAGAIAVAGAVTQSDSQQQPVDEDKKPGFLSRLKDSAETKVDSARNSAADAFSGLPGLDMLNDKLRGEQGAGADPGGQPAQPKFGISVSGSASVNLVSQDVAAYLDGADVAGRPVGGAAGTIDRIDVAALNDTVLASASGSAAITKAKADSSKFSAAIGGAVAYSMVDNDTDAHVSASRLADADAVAVHAISGGEQTNVALGVSVNASSNQSNAVSAVGSFTIGRSSNDTRAGLEDSELIAGDGDDSTLDVSAYGRTHVGTGAGSLYYGGRGGIGAAFTHADIRDETGASIEGGSISGYDRVELNALDASRIIAGAAIAGGGGQSNGLGGSVVYNNVDNATRARIAGGAQIDTDGDLVVRAAGTGPIAAFEDRLHAIDSDAEEGFNYSGAGLELDVQESDGVDLLDS
ncbi:MAG: hypothetical protein GX805_09015, partial [Gammaproteobacteria bacterium]|nr:hypothetical protein [Gammaproteobacteria bacterium]